MVQHQTAQQREACQCHRDEWQDALDDLGAGLIGRPCELGDRGAVGSSQIEDVIACGQGIFVDLAKVAQLEPGSDLRQNVVVDGLHTQHRLPVRKRFGFRPGGVRNRCHHCGAPEERLNPVCVEGAWRRSMWRLVGARRLQGYTRTAPQFVEYWLHIMADRLEPFGIEFAQTVRGKNKLSGCISDENEVVVEERPQARSDTGVD